MRQFFLFCVALLSILGLSSCAQQSQQERDSITFESNLYSTLADNFSHEYSIYLWQTKQAMEVVSTTDYSDEAQAAYLRGRVDGLLEHGIEFTLYLTNSRQAYLEHSTVLSEELSTVLDQFISARKEYLELQKSVLEESLVLSNDEISVLTQKLVQQLEWLNTWVTQLTEEEERIYVENLMEATEGFSRLTALVRESAPQALVSAP